MSTKNDTLKLILNKLKPLVISNNLSKIEEIFEVFTIEKILSKDFINYCRNRNEFIVIIFLSSLYLENITEDVEVRKILNFYKNLNSELVTKDSLSTKNFDFLTQIYNLFISDSKIVPKASINTSALEICIAIEILVDLDKITIATDLFNTYFNKLKKSRNILRIAIYLCNRNSAITPDRHKEWSHVVRFYSLVLNSVKSERVSIINSKLALTLGKICLISKDYILLKNLSNNIHGDEDYSSHQFHCAIAACHLNQMKDSIFHLDLLLENLLRQSDSFIQDKFSTYDSNSDDQLHSKLNIQSIGRALEDLQSILSTINKSIFLVSGTLLGFAREKSILSHDKDVDVGIFYHSNIDETIELLKSTNRYIIKNFQNNTDKIYSIGLIDKISNTPIDIFIYHLEDGKLVTGVDHAFGYVQKFEFTPFNLKSVDFLNASVYIPENYKLNLQENFGDWEIPDKSYISHLESPSTQSKGNPIYMIVLRLELLKSIREKNINKIQKIISLIDSYKSNALNVPEKITNKVISRFLKIDQLNGHVQDF